MSETQDAIMKVQKNVKRRKGMGLVLVFGICFLLGGICSFFVTFLFLFFAIKMKKTIFYIFSGISFLISLPFIAFGGYLVYDILKYAGVF